MKIYNYYNKANVIGPKIRDARMDLNLTQEELAIKMQLENIEVTQKVISRIEKQERFVTDYELITLMKILKIDASELSTLIKPHDYD